LIISGSDSTPDARSCIPCVSDVAGDGGRGDTQIGDAHAGERPAMIARWIMRHASAVARLATTRSP
jgi:hypothetical protein